MTLEEDAQKVVGMIAAARREDREGLETLYTSLGDADRLLRALRLVASTALHERSRARNEHAVLAGARLAVDLEATKQRSADPVYPATVYEDAERAAVFAGFDFISDPPLARDLLREFGAVERALPALYLLSWVAIGELAATWGTSFEAAAQRISLSFLT